MKRWEYRILKKLDERPNWTWWLNQAGRDGWELLAINDDTWIFKREITLKILAIRTFLAIWSKEIKTEGKNYPPEFVKLACRFGQRV